jgi:hypothetical protein
MGVLQEYLATNLPEIVSLRNDLHGWESTRRSERFPNNILRIVGRAASRLWRIDLNYAVLRIP